MEIRHLNNTPSIDPEAYVASTAVLSGQVRVGAGQLRVARRGAERRWRSGGNRRQLRDHGARGAAGNARQGQTKASEHCSTTDLGQSRSRARRQNPRPSASESWGSRQVPLGAGKPVPARAVSPITACCWPGRRSGDGQMIFSVIIKAEEYASDLLVWVELRGFEPLTPSMRTLGAEVARGRWGRSLPGCQSVGGVRGRQRCCTCLLYDARSDRRDRRRANSSCVRQPTSAPVCRRSPSGAILDETFTPCGGGNGSAPG
jgi:hypothetical protein